MRDIKGIRDILKKEMENTFEDFLPFVSDLAIKTSFFK